MYIKEVISEKSKDGEKIEGGECILDHLALSSINYKIPQGIASSYLGDMELVAYIQNAR